MKVINDGASQGIQRAIELKKVMDDFLGYNGGEVCSWWRGIYSLR